MDQKGLIRTLSCPGRGSSAKEKEIGINFCRTATESSKRKTSSCVTATNALPAVMAAGWSANYPTELRGGVRARAVGKCRQLCPVLLLLRAREKKECLCATEWNNVTKWKSVIKWDKCINLPSLHSTKRDRHTQREGRGRREGVRDREKEG